MTRTANAAPVQTILDQLEAAGLRSYQSGHNSFMAHCPAHEDNSPSLRVTEGDDGRVLLFCLAGCHNEQIVGELGLEMRDLFLPREKPLAPLKPKLVPIAGGGMATRAEREVVERETLELIRAWAAAFVPNRSGPEDTTHHTRDWERAWDVAAARSGVWR